MFSVVKVLSVFILIVVFFVILCMIVFVSGLFGLILLLGKF